MRKLIRDLGREHTILLSTHILGEVETTCDRAVVINRGRLVGEGTLDELKRRRRSAGVRLALSDPERRAQALLADLPGVASVALMEAGGVLRGSLTFGEDVEDTEAILESVVASLVAAKIGVREATPARVTLEDVFAQLTSEAESAPASHTLPEAAEPRTEGPGEANDGSAVAESPEAADAPSGESR